MSDLDTTVEARKRLLPTMPQEALDAIERGEQIWSTDEMREEFEVVGFLAPFVVVKRRSDGATGSLTFTHNPRCYFGWQPDKAD